MARARRSRRRARSRKLEAAARRRRFVAPVPADEQRVDLTLLWRDGALSFRPGPGRHLPELETGRTDSTRGLGLTFTHGEQVVRFVLDREQIKELRRYLDYQVRRIRKDTNVGATAKRRRGQSRSTAAMSKLTTRSARG